MKLDSGTRTKLVLDSLLQFSCNRTLVVSQRITLRRRRHLPDPCEPRLSPLRDENDFVLLRCDANCFHLVLPFLSIHLTSDELKTATKALQELLANDTRMAETRTPQNVLFQAFRCPGGHCHLVCHGTLNICLREKAARLLQQEMEAQSEARPLLPQAPACLV